MRHRRSRKRPEAPKTEEKPFFSKRGAQPDVQAKEEGFFQPKLTIGQPGDRYEQEADQVADALVNHSHAGSPDAQAVRKKAKIQRMEEEEAQPKLQRQEEEEAQPKLRRQEEEEAQPKLQLQEEEEAQPKLQRQEEEAQPKLQLQEEEEAVQAKAQGNQASPALQQRLAENKGKGHPLPRQVRNNMENAFEADLGGVRIHTDQEAVQMNENLGAQAFTHGQDVYFNEGKFSPESKSGKHLLAHELTHVVQQSKKGD